MTNVTALKVASAIEAEAPVWRNGELGNSESTILVRETDYTRSTGVIQRTEMNLVNSGGEKASKHRSR